MPAREAVIYEDAWKSIAEATETYRRLGSLVCAGRVPTTARALLSRADLAMQRAAAIIGRTGLRAGPPVHAQITRNLRNATRRRRALRVAAERLADREGAQPLTLEGVLERFAGRRAAPPSAGLIFLVVLSWLSVAVGSMSGLLALQNGWAAFGAILVQSVVLAVVGVVVLLRLLLDPGPRGRKAQLIESAVAVGVNAGAFVLAVQNAHGC